jgi:hypothetical protein
MHLCTKFGSSTLSCSKEIGIESCQNMSALPADKPQRISTLTDIHQIKRLECLIIVHQMIYWMKIDFKLFVNQVSIVCQ